MPGGLEFIVLFHEQPGGTIPTDYNNVKHVAVTWMQDVTATWDKRSSNVGSDTV